MRFSDIQGHQKTLETLRQLADSDNIPHAILLAGKSGIGKMMLARAFAQYIHCHNKTGGDSCGVCPSCLQHQSLNNPDTHFIYPIVKREKEKIYISRDLSDEWKQMLNDNPLMKPEQWHEIIKAGNSQPVIYVNESEDIISRASLSAFQDKRKIFIIWLPEKLRPEAANKLLKVIEEPFEDTIFILVSNEPDLILPTILSRTQKYELYGKTRRSHEFTDLFISFMRTAYALQGKKMRDLSEETAAFGREKLVRFLSYCGLMVRENYIYNLGIEKLNTMEGKEEEFSKKFSPFVNSANVEGLADAFSTAEKDITRNANAKIVMFDLIFSVASLLRLSD